MGNIIFLSQQFFSSSFPTLKSKFITRAWILKDSLSLPSSQGTAGKALLGKWLEAGSGNWDCWLQFPGQSWVFCGTLKGSSQPLSLGPCYETLVSNALLLCYFPNRQCGGREREPVRICISLPCDLGSDQTSSGHMSTSLKWDNNGHLKKVLWLSDEVINKKYLTQVLVCLLNSLPGSFAWNFLQFL